MKCCVDFYGIADMGTYHDVTMLGKTFTEAPQLYRTASPVTYVRSNAPPFLILHGTADTTVNVNNPKVLPMPCGGPARNMNWSSFPGPSTVLICSRPQRDLRPMVLQFLDAHLKSRAGKQPPPKGVSQLAQLSR